MSEMFNYSEQRSRAILLLFVVYFHIDKYFTYVHVGWALLSA